MKKKNKCIAKRKKWLAKICALVGCLLSSHLESSSFLLPRSMPAPMFALVHALLPALIPALLPALVLSPVFLLRSSAILLSCHMSISVKSAVFFLPCYALDSRRGILALQLPLPIFSLLFLLGSSTLKTFKQSLSNKSRPHISASPTKTLCLFLALGVYNLDNNNGLYNPTNNIKHKRDFDTMFINYCPLASNHDQKEMDWSFASSRCLDVVKLNRS